MQERFRLKSAARMSKNTKADNVCTNKCPSTDTSTILVGIKTNQTWTNQACLVEGRGQMLRQTVGGSPAVDGDEPRATLGGKPAH